MYAAFDGSMSLIVAMEESVLVEVAENTSSESDVASEAKSQLKHCDDNLLTNHLKKEIHKKISLN